MIPLEPKAIEQLARRFSPVLRFHESERFFPLLVESWLTTTTDGVWPEDPARAVRLRTGPSDPGRRGAAVLTADRMMTAIAPLLGPPVGGSRPIDLGADGADPYSLVADLVTKAGAEAFLDVGGWKVGPRRPGRRSSFAAGDLDNLATLCSELASAMNPSLPWTPPQDTTTRPWSWVPQPTHPTMYCEVTWAGAYPRTGAEHGAPEFPDGERSLDQMLAFTYHLFYAAREAPEGDATGRHSEGQWESITLFFRAEVAREKEGHLIRNGSVNERPEWVVISQGQDRTVDPPLHFTALEDYGACELLGEHPIVYVAKGTHRNFFHPVSGQTWDPGSHGPHGPDTTTHANEGGSWVGVDGFLASAGIMLGVAVVAIIVAVLAAAVVVVVIAVIIAIVAIIAAIVLFIMWIVSACTESSDEDAGEQVTSGGETDESGSGDGPQSGGDGSEEPGAPAPGSGGAPSTPPGGGGGGGPGATGTVGLPNTGSPTGRESAFPDIRIVERLLVGGASKVHTGFPADSAMENPAWWDYRGRWGVRVAPAPASGTWESGWLRVDEKGRDWGYFAAERLLIVLNGGARSS